MPAVTKIHGIEAQASMTINGREFQAYTVAGCADIDEATSAIRTLQQFYTVEAVGTLADPSDFRVLMSGGDDGRTPALAAGETEFGEDLGFSVTPFVF